MHDALTNLLPSERLAALSRNYFLRLGVVVVVFVTLLTFAAIVLLIPTYVLLTQSMQTKRAHLSAIESALSSGNGTALSTRLAALSSNAAALSSLARAPSASATVRAALALSRPGVTLSGLAYTPAAGAVSSTLAISGTAATRDALRSYQLALAGAPFARTADLPVSAYAKDSNIDFTITVTLKP